MKVLNRLGAMIISIIFLLFLNSCAYSTPLHQRLIIEAIGIDKENEEYVVTVQYLKVESEEEGESVGVSTCRGKSVFDALVSLTKKTEMVPMYSHNSFLLIGEDAAREGVSACLDFFVKHYESRPSSYIFIVRGHKANDILTLKSDDEYIPSKKVAEFCSDSNSTGNIIAADVVKFISDLENKAADPCTAAISIDENGEEKAIVIDGTAVFKNDKLIDFIDEDETMSILLLKGKNVKGTMSFDDEEGSKTYEIINSNNKIEVEERNGKIIFKIAIDVKANLYDIGKNNIKSYSQINQKPDLSLTLNENLRKLCNDTLRKVLYKYRIDAFDFGKYILKNKPKLAYRIENKEKFISSIEIEVDVKTKIMN